MAVTTIQNTMYILKMFRKFLEFPDLVKELTDFVKSAGYNPYSKIFIEPKVSGLSVIQWLKKQPPLNVHEYKAPTDDKPSRKAAASGSWEAKRLCYHRVHGILNYWMRSLLYIQSLGI